MNRNSEAILILCSHLGSTADVHPLEAGEWSMLARHLMERNRQPSDLLELSQKSLEKDLGLETGLAERLKRLADRAGSLQFALSDYENMGIVPVTRADAAYPGLLKKRMGHDCPPLFYAAGNLELLKKPSAGYLSSDLENDEDQAFLKNAVIKTAGNGYGMVTDAVGPGLETAMNEGVHGILFPVDPMMKVLRDSGTVARIREGRLLILSEGIPTKQTPEESALRAVCCQAEGVVVVHADQRRIWKELLGRSWCPLLCRTAPYPVNRELIRMGAVPIGEDWDGELQRKTGEPGGQLSFLV